MPLYRKNRVDQAGILGIWKIEEDDGYFERLLVLSSEEQEQLKELKARRRTEWLAARLILHILSAREERGRLIKDEFGKPHWCDSSYQISISHTHGYAAAIAARKKVGIDIQTRVVKITRLASKFMSDQEMENVAPHRAIDYLHIYWGIKESLYKAYGRRSIDYKRHLRVDPFNFEDRYTTAWTLKEVKEEYRVYFELLNDFILTYVVKK